MLNRRQLITCSALACASLALPGAAMAQATTTRIVVPFSAGGPIDVTARILADAVKGTLGTVIVENRPGAGGNIGVSQVAKSAPDGLTLGIATTASHGINPWLFKRSYVYRWAWPKGDDTKMREQQVMEGLKGFKTALADRQIRFTVILHPMLKPYSEWDEDEVASREKSLQYFKELDLEVIDLLPTMEKAIADGVNLTEAPEDYLHPSDELSERFAEEIKRRGLLGPPTT